MRKKYVVDLSEEERRELLSLIKSGRARARKLNRAHTLLLAAEDRTDEEIARTLHIGRRTVQRTRERFVAGGLPRALNERPRPGTKPKLGPKDEAFLVALACSDPPEGRTKWTMQLLADRLIELGVVDSISDETVRLTLKKTARNRGSGSSGASRR